MTFEPQKEPMPDYFVVGAERKPIPASSDAPTTFRVLSGESVTLTDPVSGSEARWPWEARSR
jgi:hypothetical protein